MNKPVYLALSVLEIRKIVKYEFWYDYVKPFMYTFQKMSKQDLILPIAN